MYIIITKKRREIWFTWIITVHDMCVCVYLTLLEVKVSKQNIIASQLINSIVVFYLVSLDFITKWEIKFIKNQFKLENSNSWVAIHNFVRSTSFSERQTFLFNFFENEFKLAMKDKKKSHYKICMPIFKH